MSMTKDEIRGGVLMSLHDLQTAISRARGGIGALVDELDAEPTSDIAGMCDDMRVLTDIATKTDDAIGELLKIHEQIGHKMKDRIHKLKDAAPMPMICPVQECGRVFQGKGWEGMDAHWRANHLNIMSYERAWPLIVSGTYPGGSP